MTQDEAKREEIHLYSLPGMQKVFRERMGELRNGDRYTYPESPSAVWVYQKGSQFSPAMWGDFLILPLPIDRDNPERGCLGMLTGYVKISYRTGFTITVDVWEKNPEDSHVQTSIGETITLALLRALARQIGEEI